MKIFVDTSPIHLNIFLKGIFIKLAVGIVIENTYI